MTIADYIAKFKNYITKLRESYQHKHKYVTMGVVMATHVGM